MDKLKKIYTFGTSFTQGGGFEFDVKPNHKNPYIGLNEELTQFNFSWPGQLQKLLPNIEVINLAKSGFGNERMYRLATDLVLDDNFKSEETLFLLEFSFLGRKEFFSKKLNDYIIVNYDFEGGKCNIRGVARKYAQTKELSLSDSKKLPTIDWFESFFNITINENIQSNLMNFNILKFLGFLNQRNIKYMIVEPPPISVFLEKDDYTSKLISTFNGNSLTLESQTGGGMTISEETNNYIEDNHYGLISSKIVSRKIYNFLIDKKVIVENKLDKYNFEDIKTKIKENLSKYD